MKKSKKAILIIVEGSSDDNALGSAFKAMFKALSVETFIVHGDITVSAPDWIQGDETDVVKTVSSIFKQSLKKSKLKPSDFLAIFQITDLDGVYLRDQLIVSNGAANKTLYSAQGIETANPNGIIKRNCKKRKNLARLFNSTKHLSIKGCKIPYYIFYMSCNLEHALWDIFNCNDEEKEELSYRFANEYSNEQSKFTQILEEIFPCLSKSQLPYYELYKESWNSVEEICDYIPRASNLLLISKIMLALTSATDVK